MATTTSKQLQQSQFSTPQEALTAIIGTGHQMVYDAKWAVQQIRENVSGTDPQELLSIVEPLARSTGWLERDLFGQATAAAVAEFGGNNQQGRQ